MLCICVCVCVFLCIFKWVCVWASMGQPHCVFHPLSSLSLSVSLSLYLLLPWNQSYSSLFAESGKRGCSLTGVVLSESLDGISDPSTKSSCSQQFGDDNSHASCEVAPAGFFRGRTSPYSSISQFLLYGYARHSYNVGHVRSLKSWLWPLFPFLRSQDERWSGLLIFQEKVHFQKWTSTAPVVTSETSNQCNLYRCFNYTAVKKISLAFILSP